jgi:hypothetical protein
MLKEIPKSDINVRPFKVYKEWTLDEEDILPIFGKEITNSAFDAQTDEMSAGQYKRVVFQSVKAQFYNNSATASVLTEVGRRISYASSDERVLEDEIALIAVPQIQFGEGIKPGSVIVNDNGSLYEDDGYSNLIDSGSNIHGNIFYDRGLIVLTRNVNSGSTLSNFTVDFRSTKTIYENEIFISVLENEFNTSTNPSSYFDDGSTKYEWEITNPFDKSLASTYTKKIVKPGIRYIRNSKYPFTSSLDPTKFASFDDYFESGSVDPTGSYLAPFITTIALYDDDLNMIAVAKLPQAIKSLPDYPLNFIIRFDS